MITAKIGNNTINCYDGKYSKEELKTWASKNIIKCPVCGKDYEYCHGQINTPYFRHKDKFECDYLYSEPETEEHIKGKIALYNWIKSQDGVSNAVLEAWITETKQRPDVMFEYGGQKWVIEFQCNPIATEQIERHKLYKAADIKDIWICGKEKYGTGRKHMEKIMNGMFDYENNTFTEIYDLLQCDLLPYGYVKNSFFRSVKLENITFKNRIVFTDNAMVTYISEDIELHKKYEARLKREEYINTIFDICNTIPKWCKKVQHNCVITVKRGSWDSPYLVMINFSSDITQPFTMFIKEDTIDICITEKYNRKVKRESSYRRNSYYWQKSSRFINVDILKYSDNNLILTIKNYFSGKLHEGIAIKYSKRR